MATNNGGGGGGSRGENVRYKECMRNYAPEMGRYVYDGCGEFLKSGDDGTPEALLCAACGCHRNFHRKEELAIHYCCQPMRLRFFHPLGAAAATTPQPLRPVFLPTHLLAVNNVRPVNVRADAGSDEETPEENGGNVVSLNWRG